MWDVTEKNSVQKNIRFRLETEFEQLMSNENFAGCDFFYFSLQKHVVGGDKKNSKNVKNSEN